MVNIYNELKDYGFEIIAFPDNGHGSCEPGTAEEIEKFAREKFGATFPIM